MMFFKTRTILIFISLATIVFAGLVVIGNYNDVKSQILNVKLTTIMILLGLSLANYIIRFLKWQFFLDILRIRVGILDSFLIFISGLSMAFTPVKIGETLKSYLLDKTYNINVKLSLPIIFTERLTDLFGLVILAFIGISSLFVNVNILLTTLFLLVVGVLIVRHEKSFYFITRQVSKIKFIGKYLKDISLFHANLRILLSIWPLVVSIILSVVSWSLEAVALYIFINSLGYQVSLLSMVFVYSFSSLIGVLAFVPGGLGVTEGSLVSLLLFLKLPLSVASLSTIIIRLATLWFGVFIGIVALTIFSKKKGI